MFILLLLQVTGALILYGFDSALQNQTNMKEEVYMYKKEVKQLKKGKKKKSQIFLIKINYFKKIF